MDEIIEHSVETLAYAAGFVDGEGNIMIGVRRPYAHHGMKNPSYNLEVAISSTFKPVLEWFKSNFGGSIHQSHSEKMMAIKPLWRIAWRWTIKCHKAQHFLECIAPFLQIKQQQAQVALDFQRYHLEHSYYDAHTQEIIKQKESYRQHLNSLHLTEKQWIQDEAIENTLPQPDMRRIAKADLCSSATLSYLAGIVDAEGHIGIRINRQTERNASRTKNRLIEPAHSLIVDVVNTNEAIIKWMHKTFSGCLEDCSQYPQRAKARYRPLWRWSVRSDAAQRFLELVIPYLIVKREQARLAIEFQNYHRTHNRKFHIHRTQEVLEQKEYYRQQISNLNQPQKELRGMYSISNA